jgi:uncharacterized protein YuzE
MRYKDFTKYFGGDYMRYWYIAFAVVIIWFTINLVNNSAVREYELTAYDTNGKVIGTKAVNANTMTAPERLPISKSYKPKKPIKFLD